MEYKFLEWNINQATNYFGNNTIPSFVNDELNKQSADIAVLTEFYFCKNAELFLKEVFDERGYNYRITSNKNEIQNEVLVAWKKDLFEFENAEVILTTKHNNKPNFLIVHLKTNDGLKVVVAGLRITTSKSYTKRKEQMVFALNKLKDYKNVVIAGDFNNLRRGTTEKTWNLTVINQLCSIYKFNPLHTPAGQSIYQEKAYYKDYEFAEDHFITKGDGIKMKDYYYCRNFTEDNPDVYLFGRDFQVYNSKLKKTTWTIPYGSGMPDHAILLGTLVINKKQ